MCPAFHQHAEFLSDEGRVKFPSLSCADASQGRAPGLDHLLRDLTATGSRNCLADRRQGLTGRDRFRLAMAALDRRFDDGALAIGLEFVYGHAWGGGPAPEPGEFRVDPTSIGRLARQP